MRKLTEKEVMQAAEEFFKGSPEDDAVKMSFGFGIGAGWGFSKAQSLLRSAVEVRELKMRVWYSLMPRDNTPDVNLLLKSAIDRTVNEILGREI